MRESRDPVDLIWLSGCWSDGAGREKHVFRGLVVAGMVDRSHDDDDLAGEEEWHMKEYVGFDHHGYSSFICGRV